MVRWGMARLGNVMLGLEWLDEVWLGWVKLCKARLDSLWLVRIRRFPVLVRKFNIKEWLSAEILMEPKDFMKLSAQNIRAIDISLEKKASIKIWTMKRKFCRNPIFQPRWKSSLSATVEWIKVLVRPRLKRIWKWDQELLEPQFLLVPTFSSASSVRFLFVVLSSHEFPC